MEIHSFTWDQGLDALCFQGFLGFMILNKGMPEKKKRWFSPINKSNMFYFPDADVCCDAQSRRFPTPEDSIYSSKVSNLHLNDTFTLSSKYRWSHRLTRETEWKMTHRNFKNISLIVVEHIFNSSTQEVEAGEPLWVRGLCDLQNEFQISQGYTEKLPRKNKQNQHLYIIVFPYFFSLFYLFHYNLHMEEMKKSRFWMFLNLFNLPPPTIKMCMFIFNVSGHAKTDILMYSKG